MSATATVKRFAHRLSDSVARSHRRTSTDGNKDASSNSSSPRASETTSAPATPDISRDIPATQHACVVHKLGGKVEYNTQFPVPQLSDLKPGQCLVRLTHSGVCHSDLHAKQGEWPVPPPQVSTKQGMVNGHEGAGVIIAIAEGTENSPVKVGDRVGVKWVADACLQCEWCRKGYEQNCAEAKTHGNTEPGTFQQYVASWVKHVTPIPKEVSSAEAAPIMCAGVTVYTAIKKAGLLPGEWIAIAGAGGGLGHLAVQYAHALGYRVIGVDTEAKRKFVTEDLKAEAFVDYRTKNLVDDIKNLTPDQAGPHAALVVATDMAAYEKVVDYVRPCGRVVLVGLPNGDMSMSVFWAIFKNIEIVASYVGNRQDTVEALELVAMGKVKTHHVVRPLRDVSAIYDELPSGRIAGRVVVAM